MRTIVDLQNFKNSNVLITGGLGFIGSNLARKLVTLGANVTLVDSLIANYGGNIFNTLDIQGSLKVNISDVRDTSSMSFLIKDKEFIFNLAGQTSHLDSMTSPQIDLDINSSAQLSILEMCRKHNPSVKIIFTSTRQIYGKPEYLPVDEKHPIHPVDVNGINKFAGESYHVLYNNVHDIKSCVLRLTNTYGPRLRAKDSRQTFLGIWVRNIIEGNPIKVFGDGLQLRDFNYVEDVVEALLHVGLNSKANGKIYNLGSSEVVGLKDLAEMMIGLRKGSTYEIVEFPEDRKAIDVGDCYSDFSLISNDIGWYPKVRLIDGLKSTLDYYERYYNHYW